MHPGLENIQQRIKNLVESTGPKLRQSEMPAQPNKPFREFRNKKYKLSKNKINTRSLSNLRASKQSPPKSNRGLVTESSYDFSRN